MTNKTRDDDAGNTIAVLKTMYANNYLTTNGAKISGDLHAIDPTIGGDFGADIEKSEEPERFDEFTGPSANA